MTSSLVSGSDMTASDRWRDSLDAWALPPELLDAAEESPYGWSQTLWKRRTAIAAAQPPARTVEIVSDLMPHSGTLLDIGVGRGRASLPIAVRGFGFIAVDESDEMLAGLQEDAEAAGVDVAVHHGRWPDIEDAVVTADVVMAANVAYNVADIDPFLEAMIRHARRGVVLEVTDLHPWAHLGDLYKAVHGLDRPFGPSADDLAQVIEELVPGVLTVHRWNRKGQLWFENWDELLDHYGRRLVVNRDRRPALRPILEPLVTEEDGLLRVAHQSSEFVTLVIDCRDSPLRS